MGLGSGVGSALGVSWDRLWQRIEICFFFFSAVCFWQFCPLVPLSLSPSLIQFRPTAFSFLLWQMSRLRIFSCTWKILGVWELKMYGLAKIYWISKHSALTNYATCLKFQPLESVRLWILMDQQCAKFGEPACPHCSSPLMFSRSQCKCMVSKPEFIFITFP